MNKHVNLNRRSFVIGTAAVGTGLAIGFDLPQGGPSVVRAADGSPEVNVWVVIRPDDTTVIRIARSEMGQGSLTGLAQLVAEELECDWSKVTTEYPTPGQSVARKRAWGDFSTGGSRGIRTSQDYVRKGGATARMMLVQAAANEWKVPTSECTAANSVITHKPSGKTTTYGKVVEAAAKLTPLADADVKLKDPKDWKIAGKGVKRLDTADKTTGKMMYSIDVKLPGMLNAAIKDCPVFGGKLKSYDEAKVAGMKGVKKVVKVGDTAVAVVADTWWHASKALEALPIVWDEGENAKVDSAQVNKWLAEGLDNAQPAYVGNQNGDAKAALASAAKKIEAVYNYPWQNHATMEPLGATALYTPDKCEVWCGTQNGEAAFAAVLEVSGLPAEKCEVHKYMLGGGFGRRGMTDYVRQAVMIAKEMPGTPVKLLWSREEDMLHGKYHPITQCKLTGALDADNNLTALHVRLSGQSILFSVRPQALENGKDPAAFQGLNATGEAAIGYTVPNLLVEHSMRNPHVPPGFWRGVNVNHNAIYLECFMDELAHAAGQDPLEFRRKLMSKHPKHLAVLNAVAEKIGWGTAPPKGVYRGIAQVMGYGSYVAGAAEISVTDGSKIKVHRIVASTDPGYVVNPAQVERQIAGSFVYGLSALFYGGCTVKGGRIEQTNFDTYNSMRIAEMPKVECVIAPSGGFWGGVGEPTIGVAAPAVLNAYFAATGKRIRSVPLWDQNISFAGCDEVAAATRPPPAHWKFAMRVQRRPTRRDAVFGIAGAAMAATLPRPSLAQAARHVAVIGGGFGGAACARALKRLDSTIEVTLIEANKTFVSCPFSNEVIAGLREFEAQQFGYDRVAADGIAVVAAAATKVDPQTRTIGLTDGTSLAYDRLVLAPGIDMRFDALPGYDEAASTKMPHAWKAGEQTLLLKRQLEAMKDGGVVVVAVPAAPLRCPPAPYERASLIAHYLKTNKPRSKVLVLDAKDGYSQQKLFEAAWKELYPGMIERIALSQGGRVTSVDASSNTVVTEFGNYTADVANIIPPQKAGRIAGIAGAADNTGWCPIDPVTFASKLVPNIHVIGDACIAGGIPKSAGAAAAQGKACAAAIVHLLAGKPPETPRLTGACYNTVAPAYAFSLSGVYQPKGDQFAEVEVRTSPVEASREIRAQEAESALSWFKAITGEMFG